MIGNDYKWRLQFLQIFPTIYFQIKKDIKYEKSEWPREELGDAGKVFSHFIFLLWWIERLLEQLHY